MSFSYKITLTGYWPWAYRWEAYEGTRLVWFGTTLTQKGAKRAALKLLQNQAKRGKLVEEGEL